VTVVARSAGLVAGARTHAHVCAADSRLTTGASVRLSPVPFMWPWLFAHVHCHAALQLLEKYLWLLAHVASDAGGKALLVGACCSFWQRAPQMRCILVRKLLHAGVIDVSSVLSYALSVSGRPTLIDGSGWELVYEVVEWAVGRQRDASAALRAAERRHTSLSEDGLDDNAVLNAEERVADAKANHDRARREAKAAFANFFAGTCAVLSEGGDGAAGADGVGGAGGVASTDPEWRRMCAGHVHALGRLYRSEFSLETVEMVAEGSDVPEAVREEVFEPLRRLAQCCG